MSFARFVVSALSLILISSLLRLGTAGTLAAPPLTGTVVHITDGRMFTLEVHGQRQKVILAGIEVPGRHQPGGAEARRLLASLLFNRQARVMDVGRDSQGRLFGRVFVGDMDVNAAMVERGYARVPRDTKDLVLKRLETRARLARKGIWSRKPPPPGPVACTMDARRCPDGTWVSRIAPDCRFAPCPGTPAR